MSDPPQGGKGLAMIELTREDGVKVSIVSAHIVWVVAENKTIVACTNGVAQFVQESYEEVLKLIEGARNA
jgi:uncharacterized protein YlzI (FlbEa/FlbD family)